MAVEKGGDAAAHLAARALIRQNCSRRFHVRIETEVIISACVRELAYGRSLLMPLTKINADTAPITFIAQHQTCFHCVRRRSCHACSCHAESLTRCGSLAAAAGARGHVRIDY